MLQVERDVRAFHAAGEVPSLAEPGFPDEGRIELRKSLIREEVGETLNAIDRGDLIEVADGIADSIVVLVGTALEFGIDLSAVWEEVQRSNMSKFPPCEDCGKTGWVGFCDCDPEGLTHCRGQGTCGTHECPTCEGRGTLILRRADGKILKPESWEPPDIAAALGLR
jgi:hypothetical protein